MEAVSLLPDIELTCRRLLSEQNRDASTPTYGCFDRRYWSWKLVDFPEATFQRNVYPLAWWYGHLPADDPRRPLAAEAVRAGLHYARRIQHNNGSFDQAFPNEQSFGATAFLLDSLLAAFLAIRGEMDGDGRAAVEDSLRRAADFLCRHDETHGHIANHLAGAVWALIQSADAFAEPRYERRARELLDRILAAQSGEGWFLEYEGADPGYQTLCMHYLAQAARRRSILALDEALDRAIGFLAWCVHPDGSFGGEYGSRRTAVYYPGGIGLLAARLPLAAAISAFMQNSLTAGTAIGLADVDIGNLAPLLSSCMLLLDARPAIAGNGALAALPWQSAEGRQDFPEAGLHMRAHGRYYSVLGVSNGGVLKVFDRKAGRILLDDAGYLGETGDGRQITTQVTDRSRPGHLEADRVTVDARFFEMAQPVPTPFQFLVLRLLNLTVMRSIRIGNMVKALLVRLLISGRRRAPLRLIRDVAFQTDGVRVSDRIEGGRGFALRRLICGRPFVAVHMASSRYYPGFAAAFLVERIADTGKLAADGHVEIHFEVR
jgi:hypothetical protein